MNTSIPPHQQRVIDEKAELDFKIEKLDDFINRNALFLSLPEEEQARLVRQKYVMNDYSLILDERIAAFKPITP